MDTASPKRITIKEWTSYFSELYYKKDKKRSPAEFWCTVTAHLSQVGEAIRRHDYETLEDSSVHAFEWMCSFVNYLNNTENPLFKLNQSLSEIVGFKYPDRCGHCMKKRCNCIPKQVDAVRDKAAIYNKLLDFFTKKTKKVFDTYTTQDWFKTLDHIFGNNIYLQSLETLGFHLLEEAGEEAQALVSLQQFQSVSTGKIKWLDPGKIENLSTIKGLVDAFDASVKEIKPLLGYKGTNDALKNIQESDVKPEVLRMRVVKAKMGLVIELADTFSWLFSILIKYTTLSSDTRERKLWNKDYSFFEDKIIKIFTYDAGNERKLACYLCGQRECICKYY
jgi:hypothetical protein